MVRTRTIAHLHHLVARSSYESERRRHRDNERKIVIFISRARGAGFAAHRASRGSNARWQNIFARRRIPGVCAARHSLFVPTRAFKIIGAVLTSFARSHQRSGIVRINMTSWRRGVNGIIKQA